MLQSRFVFAAVFFLALAISALAVVPALAQDAPDKIKKIALIPCPEPEKYAASTMQGGMVWMMVNGDNADKFTEALARDPSKLPAMITDAVEANLRAQNIEVVRIAATREKPYLLLKDYSQIQTDADVILDVVISEAGYYRPAWINDLAPGVRIRAQLVSSATKQKIMDEHFAYGRGHRFTGRYDFSSSYKFANLDSLREQLPRAKEGMEKGAEPIAAELAGKVGEINRAGISAAATAAAKAVEFSDEPEARRSDDRGSN